MEQDTELVWLPKELAAQVKEAEGDERLQAIIRKHINDSEIDIRESLRCLDDKVIEYKALMLTAKNAFAEASTDMVGRMYDVWEEFDGADPTFKRVSKIRGSLKPVIDDLETINGLVAKMRLYDMEKFLAVAEQLERMSPQMILLMQGMLAGMCEKPGES